MRSTRTLERLRRHRGDDGFTVLELIVALAVLAIIITPLTMAFIALLKNSYRVEDSLGRSADAQRIAEAWAQDVQSADADGILATSSDGTSSDVYCPSATLLPEEETRLITFRWDTAADAGGAPKLATWAVSGTGKGLTMVRRQCTAGGAADEQTIAQTFGLVGDSGTSVSDVFSRVHGPDTTQLQNFCPNTGRTCTIWVTGSWEYKFTASRRMGNLAGYDPTAAPPPPIITVAPGNTRLTVVYDEASPGYEPLTSYTATLWKTATGAAKERATVTITDLNAKAYTFENLVNGTEYWISMTACTQYTCSAESGRVSGIPVNTPPDPPSIYQVVGADALVKVSFTPPVNDGGSNITGYKIYATSPCPVALPASTCGAADAASNFISVNTLSGAPPWTVNLTGLTNGAGYRITMTATNGLGEGAQSDPSDLVVPSGAALPAVEVLAEAREASAIVKWKPAEPNGPAIARYKVYAYRLGVDTAEAVQETAAQVDGNGAAVNPQTYTFTGLANGGQYRFVVQGQNGREDGQLSAPSTPTTSVRNDPFVTPSRKSDPPAAVVLSWNATDRQFTATWQPAVFDGGVPPIRADARLYAKYIGTGCLVGECDWFELSRETPNYNGVGQGSKAFARRDQITEKVGGVNRVFGPDSFQFKAYVALTNVGEWPGATERPVYVSDARTSADFAVSQIGGSRTTPAQPGSVTATAFESGATVNWTKPTTPPGETVSTYKVYIYKDGAVQRIDTVSSTATNVTATVNALTNGGHYRFNIVGISDQTSLAGPQSDFSTPINTPTPAVSDGSVTPSTKAGPAQNVVAAVSADGDGVTVTFSAPATDGGAPITRYTMQVYGRDVLGPSPKADDWPANDSCTQTTNVRLATTKDLTPSSGTTSFTLSTDGKFFQQRSYYAALPLRGANAYRVCVVAENKGEWQGAPVRQSAGASDYFAAYYTPAAVQATPAAAATGSAAATVTYTTPGSLVPAAGPVTYQVRAYKNGSLQPGLTTSSTLTASFGSGFGNGLTNGGAYQFEVVPVVSGVRGSWSPLSVSSYNTAVNYPAVTPSTAPDAPTNVTLTRTGFGTSTLSWVTGSFNGGANVIGTGVWIQFNDSPTGTGGWYDYQGNATTPNPVSTPPININSGGTVRRVRVYVYSRNRAEWNPTVDRWSAGTVSTELAMP